MTQRKTGDGIRSVRLKGGFHQVNVLTTALNDAVYCDDGITYLEDTEGNQIAAMVPKAVADYALSHPTSELEKAIRRAAEWLAGLADGMRKVDGADGDDWRLWTDSVAKVAAELCALLPDEAPGGGHAEAAALR